jgi:beta-lactamase regulating signal transducer with metallopeptidase domain
MSLLDFTSRWVMPWLAFMADWSVRWGILLTALVFWLCLKPPRRAASRYLLCTVVLVSGLLLPLLPRWGRIAVAWPFGPMTAMEREVSPTPPPLEPTPLVSTALMADGPLPRPIDLRAEITDRRPRVISQSASLDGWQKSALLIAVVWMSTVLALFVRFAGGWLVLVRLRREAADVPEAARASLDDCRRVMSLSRPVVLATHPSVNSPLMLGGRTAMVLVPLDWGSWTESERRACLLHELAHLSHRDDWAKLGQEVIRIPFFFHPQVHWLMRRLDRERELLCDEKAVALGTDPRTYARLLIDLAQRHGRLLPLARTVHYGTLSFLDRGTVAARIEQLLEDNMRNTLSPLSERRNIAIGTATLVIALGAGGLNVTATKPPPSRTDQRAPAAGKPEPNAGAVRKLEGLVLEPDGKPAVGAIVVAGFDNTEDLGHEVFTTTEDGRFTWPLGDGSRSVYIVAHKKGLAPRFWSGMINATARAEPAELKLEKAHTFSASLIDGEGRPVAGARVRIDLFAQATTSPRNKAGAQTTTTCFMYVQREVAGSPLENLFETTTDPHGSFTLNLSGPHDWLKLKVTTTSGKEMLVRAEKADHAPMASWMTEPGFVNAPVGEPVRLIVSPAARVHGRVTTKLQDVSVAALEVLYQDSRQPGVASHGANFRTNRISTGPDGQFVIDGLSPGTINVIVYGTGEAETWTYRAAQDVALRSGETAEVALELIRGVEVEGKVVLHGVGSSVAGADVGVYGPFRPRTSAMTRGAKSGANGTYHYRLPPGETYLYVMGPPPGFTRLPGEGSSRTVNIPEGANRFEVPPLEVVGAVTLRGRVLDAAGSPVAGATVVGSCEANMCISFPGKGAVTDARGEFQLPEGGYNTVAKGAPARLLIRLTGGVEHEASSIPTDDGVITVKLPIHSEKPAK